MAAGLGYDFAIRYAGNHTVILTATVADTTGSNNGSAASWSGVGTYGMYLDPSKDPASPTWHSLHAGFILNGNMAIDAVQPFELKFQGPSELAAGADFSVQHTVTLTATAGQ